MTTGHKHRYLRVRRNGRVLRVLTGPTLAVGDITRAKNSRWVWGPCADNPHLWRLTPLGVLHALTGLTLDVRG